MQVVAYSTLKQLMAKYGLSRLDIAKTIKKSYRQTLKKLNREITPSGSVATFDINEAGQIVKFFRGLGEEVTMDMLFFNDAVSNENK